MVMPANNSRSHALAADFPGRIGLIMSPDGYRDPRGLPYALDNGRFSVWSKGKAWDESAFLRMVDLAADPLWVCVPDVVADADATFRWWDLWAPRLSRFTLALVAQDGMTPRSVRRHTDAEVIFVGGTTGWKRRTISLWCDAFARVHVGRINTERWLWYCHQCGAESCDGTGWFRGDKWQLKGLLRYLRRSSEGLGPVQRAIAFTGDDQCKP